MSFFTEIFKETLNIIFCFSFEIFDICVYTTIYIFFLANLRFNQVYGQGVFHLQKIFCEQERNSKEELHEHAHMPREQNISVLFCSKVGIGV